jgi:hypothetical protein
VNRLGAVLAIGLAAMVAFIAIPLSLLGGNDANASCAGGPSPIAVGPPGQGTVAGATVFSDARGYRGDYLPSRPDTYAELGGTTEPAANLMGGLAYLTPLRITANGRSVVAYKRDFGFGQGSRTVQGQPFVIDLYVEVARKLGFNANWSGLVRLERVASAPALTAQPTPDSTVDCAAFDGSGGQLAWPVTPHPLSAKFCERRAWESCHPGIDIAVGTGTPIHAAAPGRVTQAGPASGYGNFTCIDHGAGLSTCYAHQSHIAVRVGQIVARGQVIGAVGSTGHATGPHLHFEVRLNGSATCPARFLGASSGQLCAAGSPGA